MLKPRNIHCLALNYEGVSDANHKQPLYFIKSSSSFCLDGSVIPYPNYSDLFWTEVELGVVIKTTCKDVTPEEAKRHIEGFVVCADLTCKNLDGRDHHLAYSKSRDYFCPTSRTLVQIPESKWNSLEMSTEINGKPAQCGNTSEMIYQPAESISYLSGIISLEAGDLVLTGTPKGWRENILSRGDRVMHTIAGVGSVSFEIV